MAGGRAIAHDIEIALLLGGLEPQRDRKVGGAELADRLAEIDVRRTARLQLHRIPEAVAARIRARCVGECSGRRTNRVVSRVAAGLAKDEAMTVHAVLSPAKSPASSMIENHNKNKSAFRLFFRPARVRSEPAAML